MKDDLSRTRWLQFRKLAGHRGGITEAVEKLGKKQPQVSSFGGERPTKGIGEQLAREIEIAYGKPRFWLDGLNDSDLPTNGTDIASRNSHNLDANILVEAEQYVRIEEYLRGGEDFRYPDLRRAERLIEIYKMALASGGTLSREQSNAIIRGLEDVAQEQGDPRAR